MPMIEIRQRFGDFKPQFPLLEQMRARRDERERNALAPILLAYQAQGDMLRAAWREIQQLVDDKRSATCTGSSQKEDPVINPTVGRILYYTPGVDDPWMSRQYAPFAAIIARVNSDNTVNLGVLDGSGHCNPRPNVTLIQGALIAEPEKAYCTWMDYQRGQAARSDELIAELRLGLNNQEMRIQAIEAAKEFDFPARAIERRIEALEAREAARFAATTDHPECVRSRQES